MYSARPILRSIIQPWTARIIAARMGGVGKPVARVQTTFQVIFSEDFELKFQAMTVQCK